VEASTVKPPAPVLSAVAVVGKHTSDSSVSGAGEVESTIKVVDVASNMLVRLGGTDGGEQRFVNTVFAAIAVPRLEAADVSERGGMVVHVTIPAVHVITPHISCNCNPLRQSSTVLVGTLKFARALL